MSVKDIACPEPNLVGGGVLAAAGSPIFSIGLLPDGADLILAPNPSRGDKVSVFYRLQESALARLLVYNLAGESVAVLNLGVVPRGEGNAVINSGNWASGIYYALLQSDTGYGYETRSKFKLAVVR